LSYGKKENVRASKKMTGSV